MSPWIMSCACSASNPWQSWLAHCCVRTVSGRLPPLCVLQVRRLHTAFGRNMSILSAVNAGVNSHPRRFGCRRLHKIASSVTVSGRFAFGDALHRIALRAVHTTFEDASVCPLVNDVTRLYVVLSYASSKSNSSSSCCSTGSARRFRLRRSRIDP